MVYAVSEIAKSLDGTLVIVDASVIASNLRASDVLITAWVTRVCQVCFLLCWMIRLCCECLKIKPENLHVETRVVHLEQRSP
jgi:hypothetical protein